MDRDNMPVLLMLIAGLGTWIVTFIQHCDALTKTVSLLIVFLIFYTFGCIIKGLLNYFDDQNFKQSQEEGEVIEKEADTDEEVLLETNREPEGETL